MSEMIDVTSVVGKMSGLGFERVEVIQGSTYQDNSTIIIIPSRGMIHQKVVNAWLNLIPFMNQKRTIMFTVGHEVGHAYNELIKTILETPELKTWKYVLTLEDDNIPPPDAHLRLAESIEYGQFDAVSGIYFTKGDVSMPMAYGNPDEFRKTGQLDFKPINVLEAVNKGSIVEVNGIAMGCCLWRLDLFRAIPPPWFVTVSDYAPDKGTCCMTQDLYFCQRAKHIGKRFAVDFRVRVGHMDPNTGVIY